MSRSASERRSRWIRDLLSSYTGLKSDMSESKPSPSPGHRPVNLHVWPNHGDLLSFDVASIAALLFLQLTIPGQFSLSYCANPDLSPSGERLAVFPYGSLRMLNILRTHRTIAIHHTWLAPCFRLEFDIRLRPETAKCSESGHWPQCLTSSPIDGAHSSCGVYLW